MCVCVCNTHVFPSCYVIRYEGCKPVNCIYVLVMFILIKSKFGCGCGNVEEIKKWVMNPQEDKW